MRSTLITGSSGFVGAALTDALVRRGERVIGVDRGPVQPASGSPTVFYQADVGDPGVLGPIIRREHPDVIVVAAAVTADQERERKQPATVVSVNIGAVADAMREAAAHAVSRLVYIGSGAVYGDSAFSEAALVEDITPLRPRSLYAISKQSAEAITLRLADTFGIDAIAARLGTCFGPFERDTDARDTLSAPYQILKRARKGQPVRLERAACRDWLYIHDAVAGLLALIDTPKLPHRVYNVAAGFEWPLTSWCEILASRFPDFRWSLVAKDEANINLYDPADRAALDISRLCTDTGFRPRFDLNEAARDFLDDGMHGSAALLPTVRGSHLGR